MGANGDNTNDSMQNKSKRLKEDKSVNSSVRKPEGGSIVMKIERVLHNYRDTLGQYQDMIEDLKIQTDTATEGSTMAVQQLEAMYEQGLVRFQACLEDCTQKIDEVSNNATSNTVLLDEMLQRYEQSLIDYQSKFDVIHEGLESQLLSLQQILDHVDEKEQSKEHETEKYVDIEVLPRDDTSLVEVENDTYLESVNSESIQEQFQYLGNVLEGYKQTLEQYQSYFIQSQQVHVQDCEHYNEKNEEIIGEFKDTMSYYQECLYGYDKKIDEYDEKLQEYIANNIDTGENTQQLIYEVAVIKEALESLSNQINEVMERQNLMATRQEELSEQQMEAITQAFEDIKTFLGEDLFSEYSELGLEHRNESADEIDEEDEYDETAATEEEDNELEDEDSEEEMEDSDEDLEEEIDEDSDEDLEEEIEEEDRVQESIDQIYEEVLELKKNIEELSNIVSDIQAGVVEEVNQNTSKEIRLINEKIDRIYRLAVNNGKPSTPAVVGMVVSLINTIGIVILLLKAFQIF